MLGEDLPERIQQVQARIAEAALRVGRSPETVTLVAVSKTHPPELVALALDLGLQHFGENRVEEALPKMEAVAALRPAARPCWHMIGHVQRRKAAEVLDFTLIHSLDRLPLAYKLNDLAEGLGIRIPVLLECNISGEKNKYGFPLAGWETEAPILETFFKAVELLLELPALELCGLMTMAPIVEEAEQARPYFASLRALREVLRERFPMVDWRELSMGMTDDFEVAVEEGATLVRIGRALFGPREETA